MRIKKAQVGVKAVAKKKAAVDSVDSEMFPGKKVAVKDIRRGPYISENKKVAPKKKKMKDGGKSFPDLNKDGKITKADILKGRGVIKNGGKLKKAKSGASVKKKAMGGMKMMKGGGKCKYGC
jgi:hypothetical protein